MPSFNPNQMQGGGNTATTAIATGVTAVLLLEWGHFLNTSANLLFADGGVQLTNTSASATTVTLTITQDGGIIDTRIVSLPGGASDSVAVGSRQANLAAGFHVYNLLATNTGGGTANAVNKSVYTISGPAS